MLIHSSVWYCIHKRSSFNSRPRHRYLHCVSPPTRTVSVKVYPLSVILRTVSDVMSCHAMSCHVMSCHVLSCHVMSCHVMSCHVMSCHVMSCHVMSCHVMSWITWLVANLLPRRSRSVPGYSVRHLLWTRCHWNSFSPCTSVSPCHFQLTNAPYSYIIDLGAMP